MKHIVPGMGAFLAVAGPQKCVGSYTPGILGNDLFITFLVNLSFFCASFLNDHTPFVLGGFPMTTRSPLSNCIRAIPAIGPEPLRHSMQISVSINTQQI